MPAKMVGLALCHEFKRHSGMEAGRARLIGSGAWKQASLLLLFFGLFSLTAFAEVKPDPRMEALRHPKADYKVTAGHKIVRLTPVNPTPEELAAARGLESMMVDQMIQEMRKTVPENDIIPVSHGEKVFRQMLDSEYARMLSDSGTLGISDLVVAEMHGAK